METVMRINPACLALPALFLVILTGCSEDAPPAPEPEAEVAKVEEAPPEEPEEPEEEPEIRATLELLKIRGTAEVKMFRQERQAIYQQFLTLDKGHLKEIERLIADIQNFPWDDRPERFKSGPAIMADFIDQLCDTAQSFRERGEASLIAVTDLETAIDEGKKKMSEEKLIKVKGLAGSEMKVFRFCTLLVRNLLDEAVIYGRYGSWAMQEEMRGLFTPIRAKIPDDKDVRFKMNELLFRLDVPGVRRPSYDDE
jgi:hypothetical protein